MTEYTTEFRVGDMIVQYHVEYGSNSHERVTARPVGGGMTITITDASGEIEPLIEPYRYNSLHGTAHERAMNKAAKERVRAELRMAAEASAERLKDGSDDDNAADLLSALAQMTDALDIR